MVNHRPRLRGDNPDETISRDPQRHVHDQRFGRTSPLGVPQRTRNERETECPDQKDAGHTQARKPTEGPHVRVLDNLKGYYTRTPDANGGDDR